MQKKTSDVPVIVITGGPCGGKTTVLSFLKEKLSNFGFTVIIVKEGATEFIESGLTPQLLCGSFQERLLSYTLYKENYWREIASGIPGKTVIIADRGTMDSKSYVSDVEFEQMMERLSTDIVALRDHRYTGAIFLRSIAVDKPELYTTANNKARSETAAQAAALDARTEAAWTGIPHLCIIGNESTMEAKSLRALQAICRLLGIPVPVEIESKYLIKLRGPLRIPTPHVTVRIVQQYLKNEKPGSERIRKRMQDGGTTYYHTIKQPVRDGVRLERERIIDRKEYTRLLSRVDPDFGPIIKDRTCFVFQNQYFELDQIKSSPDEEIILEAELTEETDTVTLPNLGDCDIYNVTNDPRYSNAEIARRIVA